MYELVTIIVPVYNTRKYIERCITSIINQTHSALQIILIDDGSTDGSGDICDAFARRDTRIEVIHQQNGGISAARNAGLEVTRGSWISFVDADDYVSPHYIEDLLSAIGDNCEIAISNSINVPNSADSVDAPFKRFTHAERITGYEACVRHFGKDAYTFNISCGKLYRASIWDGLRFPTGKITEDFFVSHTLYYRAHYVAVTDAWLYAYVQSSGSIIRSEFTNRRFDVLDSWQEGVRLFYEAGEKQLLHIARRVYCSRVFDAMCVCKKLLPQERETLNQLRRRSITAYKEAKPIRGYVDCSRSKAFAYRLKLFIGRRCLPLYYILFVRGRTYI